MVTPYELRHGTKPEYRHLQVLGGVAYIRIQKVELDYRMFHSHMRK